MGGSSQCYWLHARWVSAFGSGGRSANIEIKSQCTVTWVSFERWPPRSRGQRYKGRSQEKTHLLRLEFFLLLSPLDRASSVLTYGAICSVAGPCAAVVWVFSTSGFHRLFATKPVSSETSKAERWSNLATIVLFGTRGP